MMVAALALATAAGCEGHSSPGEGAPTGVLLAMDGVTFSEYSGERLSQRARARQLIVAPASFGPFRIAMVDELVLVGVHFDLFLDDRCMDGDRCVPAALEDPALGVLRIASLKGGLPVAGARLLDVTWVLWRGAVPLARFSAREGTVRRRGGALELNDARLEHLATGRVVEAGRAIWEPGTRTFAIRGGYTFQDGRAFTRGDRARMDFAVP